MAATDRPDCVSRMRQYDTLTSRKAMISTSTGCTSPVCPSPKYTIKRDTESEYGSSMAPHSERTLHLRAKCPSRPSEISMSVSKMSRASVIGHARASLTATTMAKTMLIGMRDVVIHVTQRNRRSSAGTFQLLMPTNPIRGRLQSAKRHRLYEAENGSRRARSAISAYRPPYRAWCRRIRTRHRHDHHTREYRALLGSVAFLLRCGSGY